MICEHCGCFFCDDPVGPDGPRTRFCSKNCKNYASRKRTGLRARVENRCGRKIRYGTAGQASYALRQTVKRNGADAPPGSTYHCGDCGGWHVTSRSTPIPIRPYGWDVSGET